MKDTPGASLSDSCGLRYLSSLQPRSASTPESCVAPCSISQNPSPGSQIPSTSRNSSAIRPHNGRTRTSSCHSTGQLVADLEVLQICEAFGANRYPFPEEPQRQQQMNSEVNSRLRELHSTIDAGEPQSHDSISLKVPRSPGPTAMAAAVAPSCGQPTLPGTTQWVDIPEVHCMGDKAAAEPGPSPAERAVHSLSCPASLPGSGCRDPPSGQDLCSKV